MKIFQGYFYLTVKTSEIHSEIQRDILGIEIG